MSEKNNKPTEKSTSKDLEELFTADLGKLRNEGTRTNVQEMVHPLSFSYDGKKHPDMQLIPPWCDKEKEKLKTTYFEVKE